MENFGFDALVRQAFAFLLNAGFRLSETNPTRVGYQSDLYGINIFYGPHSREIDIEIYNPTRPRLGSASFNVLIAAFDKRAGWNMPSGVAIETREEVEERIRTLAAEFKRHVDLEQLSSPDLWDRVESQAMAMGDARYPSIPVEDVQKRFSELWEAEDYATLLLWEPLRECLTDDERQKLDIARERVRAAGQRSN